MIYVKKALNNNVIIAEHPEYEEIILIGKGLGFGKRPGDTVAGEQAEKFFVLKNTEEQKQYMKLLEYVDESFIALMDDIITRIEERFKVQLNEHIHVGLTDHLFFAIKRIREGLGVKNPFRKETELAYPKEYAMAEEIVESLSDQLDLTIPEGEIGFIALHIHSALTNRDLAEINKDTQLVASLVEIIEENLKITVDKTDMNYLRLVRHIHHAIERVQSGDYMEEQETLKNVLQEQYPVCYNLSWKLMKVMQQKLKKPVPDAEAVYLTLHLQRLMKR
ncbi:transcription antiterminator [Evansella sp. LMS18]|uniref:glucose PTS transporter transcription antiterminator GlcT n=1 Tax=Evansella sp. LMS18 TaxID=2924033 RepID=UPI0020D18D2A|nr:transcription antiterminator [Evansella sp. LMS18]UTR12819.1 transcription antiterminator [Evansella sp. LMS18]